MLQKLVSLWRSNTATSATAEDEEFHDIIDDETDSGKVFFEGSLFSLSGSDVELVRSQVYIKNSEDGRGFVMLDDPLEQPGVDDIIEFNHVISVRQHKQESVQFVRQLKNEPPKEFGIHFTTPDEAAAFRQTLMMGISSTCSDVLGDCSVLLTEDWHENLSSIDSIGFTTRLRVVQRDEDLLTLMVFDSGLIVEVNRDLHLEVVKVSTGEILFLGPFSFGDSWERRWCCAKDVEETLLLILMRCYRIENTVIKTNNASDSDSEERVTWDDLDQLDKEIEESQRRQTPDSDREEQHEVELGYESPVASHLRSVRNLSHKFMEVGDGHSFVCRGNGEGDSYLEVIDNTTNKSTVIDGRKFVYNSTEISPSQGLLRGQDKMVVLDGTDRDDVYEVDIEREKVVTRYSTEGLQARMLWPRQRDNDNAQTFMAAASDAFYQMDSRVGARTVTKEYKTNPSFSAGACDGHGHVALGSRDGVVRLYDSTTNEKGEYKIAKNRLAGPNGGVTAIDTNYDGTWVLVTKKNCLLLYPVQTSSGSTGFEKRLGYEKSNPLVLELKPSDIRKYKLKDINFRRAVFDQDQQAIITSTGSLAIIWDFQAIKKNGKLKSYSIMPLDGVIEETKTRSDGTIIVAKKDKIQLLSTKKKRA